jgi:alpha/beta superfamily hydrolase
MNESAFVFGPRKSLVGILTEPPAGAHRENLGVVLFNAGVLHRTGPARIHVALARELAALGVTVLRFDFSGIGDSPRAEGATHSFVEQALADAGEALDHLSSRGIDRFVTFGICSGADMAIRTASRDARIVGVATVDGYNIPTPWSMLLNARRQVFKLRSWVRLLSGRSLVLTAVKATAMTQQSAETSIFPSYRAFVAALRTLVERRSPVLLGFSGGSSSWHHFNHGLRGKVPFWPNGKHIQAVHLHDTDHTFTLLNNQRRFVTLVRDWVIDSVLASTRARVPLSAAVIDIKSRSIPHATRG